MTRYISSIRTIRGKKPYNEDSARTDPGRGIHILADGFTGQEHDAAHFAVDALYKRLKNHRILKNDDFMRSFSRSAIYSANEKVHEEARRRNKVDRMSMTLDLALFSEDLMYLCHIGDARVYRWDGNELEQITRDDKQLQVPVENGSLDSIHAKFLSPNMLTRRYGKGEKPEYAEYFRTTHKGDRILMATDGLIDVVTDRRIKEVLHSLPHENVLDTLEASYTHIDDEIIGHFLEYSNEVYDWFNEETFTRWIGNEPNLNQNEVEKLWELHTQMERVRSTDGKYRVLHHHLEDDITIAAMETSVREYLSGRDNCTMILIDRLK